VTGEVKSTRNRSEVNKNSEWSEVKSEHFRNQIQVESNRTPSPRSQTSHQTLICFICIRVESVLTRVIHKALAKPKRHGHATSNKHKWKGNLRGQSNVAWWFWLTRELVVEMPSISEDSHHSSTCTYRQSTCTSHWSQITSKTESSDCPRIHLPWLGETTLRHPGY
jgi:hypothetical protein